jgi:hypothetical protein
MTKVNKDLKTKKVKETDNYTHFDIKGVNINQMDEDSFQTVNLPNGSKLVIGRNKKTDKLQGTRLLIPKKKRS